MARYITIEREYGSGGRAVAGALAQECGIACYGREILEKAGQMMHIPVSQLERYEECATSSFLYSVNLLGKAQSCDPDMLMREGHLFVAEQLAIRELAAQGPAVFLGHCACQALRDEPGVLRVFIRASMEARRQRITREYGLAEGEVDAAIRRFDKKRAGYYSINTARKWHDLNNYDVVLDSSVIGVDGCVGALKALVTHR